MHLLAPASFGGLERVVEALAIAQKGRGYDVHVAALLENGVDEPPLVSLLSSAGITVHVVTRPARSYRAQRREVTRIVKKLSPAVLHSHGYLPDVLSASLNKTVGVARVSTVHGFTGGGWKNRLYEFLQRLSYFQLDAVVAVSRPMARRLASSPLWGRRIYTLPNAWMPVNETMSAESARAFLDLTPGALNVGWVGRMTPEKGLDVMIEALAEVRDLPIRVTLIGNGQQRAQLLQYAKDLGVGERISWRGEVAGAGRLMPAFDVFVNSSRSEGTPITLLEAMHCCVPIIATAVGGVPDVVSSEEAILVPPEHPAALAAAIRQIFQGRAAAQSRAARAKQRLERDFALTPWMDAYDRIYRQAMARIKDD